MRKRTILIATFILILIIIAGGYLFYFRSASNQFTNFNIKIAAFKETYYHVKSYKVFQPLKKGLTSEIDFTLDSPRIGSSFLDSPRLAYDTASVSADVLNASLQLLKSKYCLYNLNSQNLIASSDSSK